MGIEPTLPNCLLNRTYFLMFQYKDDITLPQRLPMYIPTDAASRRGNRIESTTLEDKLVDCLRRCWNDPMYRRGISVRGKVKCQR